LLGNIATVTLDTTNNADPMFAAGNDINITGTVDNVPMSTLSAFLLRSGTGGTLTFSGAIGQSDPIASVTDRKSVV